MALNPPIVNGLPVGVMGENFLVTRHNIKLACKIQDFSIKSTGSLFLSNYRMVFVADKPDSRFASIDLPLACIQREKFNQPIFGTNYLSCSVSPITNMGITSVFDVKLYFNNGGADTFLKLFWTVMAAVRYSHDHTDPSSFPQPVQAVATGTIVQTAFIDPSDSSVIYTQQPNIQYVAIPTAYPVPVYAQATLASQPTYSQTQPVYAQPIQVQPVQTQPVYAQPVQVQQAYPQAQPAQAQQVYPQAQQVYPQAQQVYPQAQPVQAQQVYPQAQPVQAQQVYPQSQTVPSQTVYAQTQPVQTQPSYAYNPYYNYNFS